MQRELKQLDKLQEEEQNFKTSFVPEVTMFQFLDIAGRQKYLKRYLSRKEMKVYVGSPLLPDLFFLRIHFF